MGGKKLITKIKKRDGREVAFNLEKLQMPYIKQHKQQEVKTMTSL